MRVDGNLTGRVGDLGFGFTNPVPDGARLIGAGFDAVALVVVEALVVVLLVVEEEPTAGLAGSFVVAGLVVKGDFEALVVVFAVETGATVLEAGFAGPPLALAFVVAEAVPLAVPLRTLPAPSSKMVPPSRAADGSVGLPGSILVRGSSSSVTLSGLALCSNGGFLTSFLGEIFTGMSCLGDSGIAS